jgi:ATP-binding cassette subfamily F protein 3
MDEPTNHLDLASKEVLEEALSGFTGTIVFISHDRYFINTLATKLVEVRDGRLITHLGDYETYRQAVEARVAPPPVTSPPRTAGAARPSGEAPRPSAPDAVTAPARPGRRRVDPTVRAMRQRLATLETDIQALEERLRALGDALGDPALYTDGERARTVTAERARAEAEVAWLLREWEELSTAVAGQE